MNNLRVGSWVRYKIEKAKNSSNDPFSIPSSTNGEKEVYAVVIQIDDNNCIITYQDESYNVPIFKTVLTSIGSVEMVCPSLYGSDWEPEDEADINNMSDKNLEIIKHIQQTGCCPEDNTLATSEYHCSGYQPKGGVKFKPKKSINTNPPHISTSNKETTEEIVREHEHNYVDISACANPDIDYSGSLFDPNEKDPAMRALNMVKEFCNVSIREINQNRAISTNCFKADAYQDVIDFIQEHQNKCHAIENQEVRHLENDSKWYKQRMEEYRKSFFMVCNLIDTCGVPESIKYFVKQEELRY